MPRTATYLLRLMAMLKISAAQSSNTRRPERRTPLLLVCPAHGVWRFITAICTSRRTLWIPSPATFRSSIMKVTASGVQTLFATLNTVNSAAEGMAIDRAGNVFVVAFDQNDPALASTIFKFTPDGTGSTFGSVPGQSLGIAFDAAGNLFASDATDSIIFKFTPAGASSVFVGPT